MQRFSLRNICYLVIDVILLVLCIINIPSVLDRAGVPFDVQQNRNSVVVTRILNPESAGGLQSGDRLVRWDALDIALPEVLEFLGDLSSIGQRADIVYERNNELHTATLSLIPYYDSPRFLIVSFCVGFITWLVGVFILMYRKNNPAAEVLHWALIALAVTVMITWGSISTGSWFPLFARTLFFVSYTLTPSLYLLFTTMYPNNKFGTLSLKSIVIFFIAAVLIAGQSYYHLEALRYHSLESFASFQKWFNAFNIFLLLSVGGSIFNLLHSYLLSVRSDDKRRLEWIMWGFSVSPVPFLLFIKLPQLFGITAGLVPEEVTTIFFLLIPFSCAVSLVKYNLVDIRVVINRSIVYSALTLFISVMYVLTVLLAATSFDTGKKFQEYTFVGIVFVIIGLLLNPVRRRMQRVLDELLFPARVHFRATSSNIRTELRQCLTPNDVYAVLTDRTLKALSFETFALYSHAPKALILVASHNGNFKQSLPFSEQEQFHVQQINAGSIPAAVNFQRSDIVSGDSQLLENLHCSIYVPLIDESKTVLGIAAGTPSIISDRFTEEEVDLLITICAEAAETLSRLLVQERMIIQHEERRRFEELSNLKSYFVSSVSHELRTPLTSIRMFAEMLRTSKTLPPRKRSDYLRIIQGESERLSRLVDNVLDFAKIERGEESYHFREVDLKDIVRRAVYAVQYQVEKQDMVLTVSFSRNLPRLYADADALEEVVINLLSNALKYSAGPSLREKRKSIWIRVKRVKHHAVIEVADRGIGIPKREIQNIFGKFYRVNDPQTRQAGGAGLGLALVKHIIESHGGDIEVRSTVGKGSTFTIRLPLKQRNIT